jgi:hypothetical protein
MKRLVIVFAACALVACTQSTPPAGPTPVEPAAQAPVAQPPTPAPEPPPAATPPAVPKAAVPARFHGGWASDTAACTAAGHESRLVIGPATLQFHESSGPVTGATANGDDMTVTVELTGEGQTRESSYRFSLSGDGNALTDRDSGMVRTRCRM